MVRRDIAMNETIVLDADPPGTLCHPRNPPHAAQARRTLAELLAGGRHVVLPEIADYEVRRELLRLGSVVALANLDALATKLSYLPLTTNALRRAAKLWAAVRKAGRPTAGYQALDGDVILAAQALELGVPVVVATGNPDHLSRFVAAATWSSFNTGAWGDSTGR